ncbi:hypothetical protein JL722_8979 [Aureococcus anophagefferens]|nr:hypothetical protein JL722_8979 [Aureococcus anophagefferens]
MEAKVALWREVESGARYTATTAMARYPQLHKDSLIGLSSEVARKPKIGKSRGCDVKTYSAADVDALAARLAAVDPRWLEVESGARYTQTTAMARYPQLKWHSLDGLPCEVARKPKSGKAQPCDVKTYVATDVNALAARLAAVDPRWLEVESGARYTLTTAMARYPQLSDNHFQRAHLPFEMARKPYTGTPGPRNVKTYSAADVEAPPLRAKSCAAAKPSKEPAAAAPPSKKRAAAAPPKKKAPAAAPPKKRARAKQPAPPQEPKEEDECAICFADASRTHACVPCGHKCVCASCASTHLTASGSRCPICREEITATVPRSSAQHTS